MLHFLLYNISIKCNTLYIHDTYIIYVTENLFLIPTLSNIIILF